MQNHEIRTTRHVGAMPEQVFAAWLDPQQLTRWFGPRDGDRDFTTPHAETDPRAGGTYRVCIRSPQGDEYWANGRYEEIEAPHRLVFTHGWEDEHGHVDHHRRVEVGVTERDGGTEVSFAIGGFRDEADRDSEVEGWNDCLDRLVAHFAELGHEIVITRQLDAPRKAVWEAWTQPFHLTRWWGPEGFTTRVVELDLRSGGRWHYVMVGPDGAEHPERGIFREVVAPRRVVVAGDPEDDVVVDEASAADLPEGVVTTCLFEEVGRRTRLTIQMDHPSDEDRRKHLALGIVDGWNSSLDCLERHLAAARAAEA